MDTISIGKEPNARRSWLYLTAGEVAVALAALFLIEGLGALLGWNWVPINWLIILFQANTPAAAAQPTALSVLRPGDLVLMFLFGLLMVGLYPRLRRVSRIWAVAAAVLPFLGILVFLITAMAGRSAVLLAGLVCSLLMQRGKVIRDWAADAGLVASALLLFVGDFASAALPPSLVIAILIAIGYILWVVWLSWVAVTLHSQSRAPSSGESNVR